MKAVVALMLVVAVVGAVIWFDLRCLIGLGAPPAAAAFIRQRWAMIIIFGFLVRPILYLSFAKDLPTR